MLKKKRKVMKWENLTKIAVVGNRKFREKDLVTMYLHQYIREHFKSTEDVIILTNGDVGIGNTVELWAQRNGIKNLIVSGRWLELELPAGPRRNSHIVDLADQMFAFRSALLDTTGGVELTNDIVRKAEKKGIPLEVYTVKQLRKILGVKNPPKIYLASDVKGIHIGGKGPKKTRRGKPARDTIASLMEDIGGIDELKKFVKKKKKHKYNPLEDDYAEKNGRFED